jgi:hypothetical protein
VIGIGRVTEPPPKHDVVTVAGNLQALGLELAKEKKEEKETRS